MGPFRDQPVHREPGDDGQQRGHDHGRDQPPKKPNSPSTSEPPHDQSFSLEHWSVSVLICPPMLNSPSQLGKYRCVVVDPPWDQGKTGLRAVRPNQGASLDYPTMTQEQIRATAPIDEWASKNAFIWLWATNSRSRSSRLPILQQAFDLLDHWGFRYYTMLTWSKGTGPCPFGPYQITTEHCLFGYRGKCQFPKSSLGKMKTMFEAKVTRHSEKPASFYQHIQQYFPGPRLDVFARRSHTGFEGWGSEAQGTAA